MRRWPLLVIIALLVAGPVAAQRRQATQVDKARLDRLEVIEDLQPHIADLGGARADPPGAIDEAIAGSGAGAQTDFTVGPADGRVHEIRQ